MREKVLRSLEGLFLFVGVPSFIFFELIPAEKFWILLVITIYCLAVLYFDKSFHRENLWNVDGLKKHIPTILIRMIPAAVVLFLVLFYMEPENLFILIKEDFNKYLVIMALYPLISVVPQELIYRSFFFHRYQVLFPKQRHLIHVSALAFGFLHIIYFNMTAVFLTYGAGYLFGKTYAESKSLLAVSLEHALYGMIIFTIGYGQYFYDSFVTSF